MTNQEAIEVLKLNNPFMAGKDKETFSKAIDRAIEVLEKQKTGHWIDDEFGSKCSRCDIHTHLDKFGRPMKFRYCSMCGAKMEGENK